MLTSLFSKTPKMEWNQLSTLTQLENLHERSKEHPIVIFKHSTRCSISAMALSRFERNYEKESGFDSYFLDLIADRDLSNQVAEKYKIVHQSPQVILIKNGKVVFEASHNAINFKEVSEQAKN